jgi:ankyrin repeat protein
MVLVTAVALLVGAWAAVRACRRRDLFAARLAAGLGVAAAGCVVVLFAIFFYPYGGAPERPFVLVALGIFLAAVLVSSLGIVRGLSLAKGWGRGLFVGALLGLGILGVAATGIWQESSRRLRRDRMTLAAETGDTAALTRELAGGGRADTRSRRDETLLVLAARKGHAGAVAALLAAGVDLRSPSSQAGPALIGAARGGHVEVVRLLLSGGADPDAAAASSSPRYAVWSEVAPGVKELLRGAGAHHVDFLDDKRAALLHAAASGDEDRYAALWAEGIFWQEDRSRAIESAAAADQTEFVLRRVSAEYELVDALYGSARAGSLRTFEALLPRCQKDHERRIALRLASKGGHVPLVRAALAAGVVPEQDLVNDAAVQQHPEVVRLLLPP